MKLQQEAQCVAEILAMLNTVTLTGKQVPTYLSCVQWLRDKGSEIHNKQNNEELFETIED